MARTTLPAKVKPQPKKRGPVRFVPTKEQRKDVEKYAAVGAPQMVIASILGIHVNTLPKHFRDELDNGLAKANAMVGGKLFTRAMEGDNACIFFWMKTRAGWRDVSTHEHSGPGGGPIPLKDMSGYSDEQLDQLARAAAILAGGDASTVGESEASPR